MTLKRRCRRRSCPQKTWSWWMPPCWRIPCRWSGFARAEGGLACHKHGLAGHSRSSLAGVNSVETPRLTRRRQSYPQQTQTHRTQTRRMRPQQSSLTRVASSDHALRDAALPEAMDQASHDAVSQEDILPLPKMESPGHGVFALAVALYEEKRTKSFF